MRTLLALPLLILGGCAAAPQSNAPQAPSAPSATPSPAPEKGPAQPAPAVTPAADARTVRFPDDWIGRWEGPAELIFADGKRIQFRMGITVAPLLNSDGKDTELYSWTIVYDGDQGFQERKYLLKPVDKAKNLWEIDERNGIVLPCSWINQTLAGGFTVPGNTITTTDRLQGVGAPDERIVSEMIAYPTSKNGTTGPKGAQAVITYQASSIQRAELKRISR